MESQHYSNGKPASSKINLEQYRTKLFKYSLKLTRNYDDAEDLTQETFIHATRDLGSLRDPDSIGSWLYRIASNINTDKHRKKHETPVSDRKYTECDGDGRADSDYIDVERHYEENLEGLISIMGCLDDLKPEHRDILKLRADSWPYCDISKKLRIPIGTVRSRLHTAKKVARERLLEEAII